MFLVLAAMVMGAAVTPMAATGQEAAASTSAHVVTLHPDGSAQVTLRLSYDLTTHAEQAAFASLRNDSETQAAIATTFEERLSTVAQAVADETGRETAVTDATLSVATSDGGDIGVVTLAATWTNLAAVDGDRLVLTEPYASGFATDRRFVVRPPEGYVVVETTSAPTADAETGVAWSAESDLDGFRLVAAPADDSGEIAPEGVTGTAGQPGFGPLGALVGLVAAATLVARARSG